MKKQISILIILIIGIACVKESNEDPIIFDTTAYPISIGDFPDPEFPTDNIPTREGVKLGRMLFYEKKLSKGNTQSCADCHRQQHSFSDSLQFSLGVETMPGKRQAMAIMNLAWHANGMFWDGRSPSARDQALRPIQDPLEMNETLENVVNKLKLEKKYRDQFFRAFGDELITKDRIGKAIEQFEFIMISNNSKFDRSKRGEITLSESEERGRKLFFTEFDPSGLNKGAECFHCHGGFNFTNDEYMNNGLDLLESQKDNGREEQTKIAGDHAKFKVPSLRNIALSFPYMHDGRFQTLEEVVDFYNSNVQGSPTVDPLMQYNLQTGGLGLNSEEKSDLVAFLKTLSDADFLTNPNFKNPF